MTVTLRCRSAIKALFHCFLVLNNTKLTIYCHLGYFIVSFSYRENFKCLILMQHHLYICIFVYFNWIMSSIFITSIAMKMYVQADTVIFSVHASYICLHHILKYSCFVVLCPLFKSLLHPLFYRSTSLFCSPVYSVQKLIVPSVLQLFI